MQQPQDLLQVVFQGFLLASALVAGCGVALFLLGLFRAAIRGAARGYMRERMRDREGHLDVPEIAEALEEMIKLGDRPHKVYAITEDGRVKAFEWDAHDNTYKESETHTLVLRTSEIL